MTDDDVKQYLAETPEIKEMEEEDIYHEEILEPYIEDDLISVGEEGFMRGYLEG